MREKYQPPNAPFVMKRKIIIGLALAGALLLAWRFYKNAFQDDEKKIRETIEFMRAGAEQKNVAAVMRCFSRDYKDDNGNNKFTVNIIDGDGKSIDAKMPIKADMPVESPDEVPFLHRNLILNLQGLKFTKTGVYFIDVCIENELIQRLPLRVVQIDKNKQNRLPDA